MLYGSKYWAIKKHVQKVSSKNENISGNALRDKIINE